MAASLTVATVRAQEQTTKVEPSPSPTVEVAQVIAVAEVVATPEPTPTPALGSGGTISGTVTDVNGAVIPGTSITIVSEDGKAGFKGKTDDEGRFTASAIPAGSYTITFEAQGFRIKTVERVGIYDGQAPRVDVSLDVRGGMYACAGDCTVIEYSTKLAQAVADDDIDEVKNLLGHGENVNGKDENYDNITPLFIAVENGNVEMVKLLLDFGAKVNARNKDKQTPLMYIDDDATPELIDALLRGSAKVDVVDKEGNTPLIRAAAEECDVEIIKALIDAGADVKAANKEGRTALLNAADNDDIESVRALIVAGSDVNAKDSEGENAWDLTGNHDIELLLVASGTVAHPKLDENGGLADATATPSPTPPLP